MRLVGADARERAQRLMRNVIDTVRLELGKRREQQALQPTRFFAQRKAVFGRGCRIRRSLFTKDDDARAIARRRRIGCLRESGALFLQRFQRGQVAQPRESLERSSLAGSRYGDSAIPVAAPAGSAMAVAGTAFPFVPDLKINSLLFPGPAPASTT